LFVILCVVVVDDDDAFYFIVQVLTFKIMKRLQLSL